MNYKEQSDKTTIFVNNTQFDKVDKKTESKTTPRVSVELSTYDKIVQLVTNDNPEVKPPQEEPNNRVHMSV